MGFRERSLLNKPTEAASQKCHSVANMCQSVVYIDVHCVRLPRAPNSVSRGKEGFCRSSSVGDRTDGVTAVCGDVSRHPLVLPRKCSRLSVHHSQRASDLVHAADGHETTDRSAVNVPDPPRQPGHRHAEQASRDLKP